MSVYGARAALDFKTFKILWSSDNEVVGATGCEDVRLLDLSGLLSGSFTLGDLTKCLTRKNTAASLVEALDNVSLDAEKGKETVSAAAIAESWEEEADSATVAPLPSTLSVPVFSNLTRLSLAHPGTWASWTGLLKLSTKLNTITHLSLAYWPIPSTTPNALTTDMVSKQTRVSLGGSHFYSEIDDDWDESANILRRLSLNTYCLKWLDLEGCAWHKALTFQLPPNPRAGTLAFENNDEWVKPSSSCPGPDWNDAWRQIEYLNLSQGWIPKDQHSIMTMPAGIIPVHLLGWLRAHEDDEQVQHKLRSARGDEVDAWVEREKAARNVGFTVNAHRRAAKQKRCIVDHGWEADAASRALRKKELEDDVR